MKMQQSAFTGPASMLRLAVISWKVQGCNRKDQRHQYWRPGTQTLAPYCPFYGMQNDFMAPIHFLTATLCNIFTSPLRCRPRARQC